MEFSLDQRLANDTVVIGQMPLSLVLLSRDANYPWCILVPQRAGIREVYQLNEEDQRQYLKESSALAHAMERAFEPFKMNIAALGNVVPQLHIHHIARFEDDAAWPAPIWGAVPAMAYEKKALADRVVLLQTELASSDLFVPFISGACTSGT